MNRSSIRVVGVILALGFLATARAEEWVVDGRFNREKEWAGTKVIEAGEVQRRC